MNKGNNKGNNKQRVRKAYLDIEASYIGKYNIDMEGEERNRAFRDFNNWILCKDVVRNGKTVRYSGIIGILIVDYEVHSDGRHTIVGDRLVQLIGEECTKENLMRELDGTDEILSYHGRTKPDFKGRIGYDFGVIAAQLGVVLDDLIKSTDLELDCHRAGIYGGLKGAENEIAVLPPRISGITDGKELETVLYAIAACEDEKKKDKLWKKAKRYNLEDVISLPMIEKYIRRVNIVG